MEEESSFLGREAYSHKRGPLYHTIIPHVILHPSRDGQKIDKVRSRFLWGNTVNTGRKFHLVSWDQACKAGEEAGLSILNMKNFILALIAKWWWRLLSNSDGANQILLT